MKYCSHCGIQLADNDAFCSRCGKPVYNPASAQQTPPFSDQQGSTKGYANTNPTYNQPNQAYSQPVQKVKRPLNILNLIWGIVNSVLGTATFLPLILGIVAIVFTVTAQDAVSDYDYQDKLKIAKILNIVATVLCVLGLLSLIFIFSFIFGTLSYFTY